MLRIKIATHLTVSEILAGHFSSMRSAAAHFGKDSVLCANTSQIITKSSGVADFLSYL